ncbi:CHAD domain-containing protein [Rhodococcus triatomae]
MGTRRRRDRAAVVDHARALTRRLTAATDAVRANEPDAVHQMRVTARRLRSVLRTYSTTFPRSEAVRDELRWLGTVLGEARDAEVLADHFAEVLDGLSPHLVRGTARYRLVDAYRDRYRVAHGEAVDALASPRFTALLSDLEGLCERPAPSGRPRKEFRRARRRVLKAGRRAGLRSDATSPGPDTALHRTRKRAKALRYAGEALSASRSGAERIASAAEDLQTVLGTHQDAVVARDEVLAAADRARAAGEDTFTYGVVAALETRRARTSSKAGRRALNVVRRRGTP